MSQRTDILTLCGSNRRESINKVLLEAATAYLLSKGMTVLSDDLKQLDLPIYSEDLHNDSGVPEKAVQLRQKIESSRGILICSPEYNGSVTPLLKNVIDWTSRPFENNGPAKVFQRKIVCLAGATRGDKSALRGLSQLSSIFLNMGSIVVPQFYGLSYAGAAFDQKGALKDSKVEKSFQAYLETFISLLNKW